MNVKIDADLEKFLKKTYIDADTGINYSLHMFPSVYKETLSEIKSVFKLEELYLIIDIFNGFHLTAKTAGQHIINECRDKLSFDGLDSKWKVNKDKLLEKIDKITAFQVICLEIWASSYWYGGGIESANNRSDLDLERHVELLL